MRGRGERTGRSPPDTLGVENTVRTGYLMERIRGAYYANSRVRQQVVLGEAAREEMPLASPESTLKIVVAAKYLFLEICVLEIQGEEVWRLTEAERGRYDEIICEVEAAGCGDLAGAFRQDLETVRLIVDLRDKYSSHPTFPLREAIARIDGEGFERFWQCARRLLLLKRAAETASGWDNPPAHPPDSGQEISGLPHRFPTEAELEEVKRAHEGPMLKARWPKCWSRQVMRECAACIRILLDEFCIARSLHQTSQSAENKARLCNTVYSLKYAVLEMHNFIESYAKLNLSGNPGFMKRKKWYKRFKNQYGAHTDEDRRVVSLTQLLGKAALMQMLVLDMHEALCLSRRLFEDFEPQDRIRLPTRAEIASMDADIEGAHQTLHRRLGGRFASGEHEKRCAEFRARIQKMCGLE